MAMSAITSQSAVGSDDSVSMAVVRAVSSAADRPVLELPPLYEFIDPDALDALFDDHRTASRIEFRYAGFRVTVRADRTVAVSPVE
jgi:hypothetical protein